MIVALFLIIIRDVLLISAQTSTEVLALRSVTGSSSVSDLLFLINSVSCYYSSPIIIDELGINYHRDSRVLEYGVVGYTDQSSYNPSVTIAISEFGHEIYSHVFNMCGLATCPVHGSFVLRGAVVLGYESAADVPSLAWSFPDLDAGVTITLWDNDRLLSCVSANISNGLSTLIPLISIITATVALALIVIGSLKKLLRASDRAAAEPPGMGAMSVYSPPLPPTSSDQPRTLQAASDTASITSAERALSQRSGISGTSAWEIFPALSQMGQDLQLLSYPAVETSYYSGASHIRTQPGTNIPTYQPGSASHFHSTSVQTVPHHEIAQNPTTVSPPISSDLYLYNPYDHAGYNHGGQLSTVDEVQSLQYNAGNQLPPHALESTPVQVDAPTPVLTRNRGPPAEWMDPMTLFLHFQYISSSALLSLRYPPLYLAFAANFAWANFLLPLHAFKNVARKMRKCDLIEDIRRITPFTQGIIPGVYYGPSAGGLGIPAYAYIVGLEEQDIFPVVFLVFLCACAVVLAVSAIVSLVLQIGFIASSSGNKDVWMTRKGKWQGFTSSNILCVMILALGTVTTFAFYGWRRHACKSVVFYVVSSLAFLLVTITLCTVSILVLRVARRHDGAKLLFDPGSVYARRWGTIYGALQEKRLFFVGLFPFVGLARSAIVAFGQGYGLPQLFAMMSLDVIVVIVLIVRMPYNSPGCNRVYFMLESTRVVSDILMILFVENFNFSGLVRNITGLVIMALNSLVALIIFALTVINLGWGTIWARKQHLRTRTHSMAQSYDEMKVPL